ncbi:MAG TPA: hypothetical protein DD473_19290 [Planctomycetaceae bacterium]|nr:hypothetical protein [Planctomycetaceae bacterium]
MWEIELKIESLSTSYEVISDGDVIKLHALNSLDFDELLITISRITSSIPIAKVILQKFREHRQRMEILIAGQHYITLGQGGVREIGSWLKIIARTVRLIGLKKTIQLVKN